MLDAMAEQVRDTRWKGGEPDPVDDGEGKADPQGKGKVKVARSPTRCPFCHEDVAADSAATVCQACLSRHHAPCWSEGGRCGSCGQTRALEAAPERAGPGGCACCGLQQASARYACPGCRANVCEGCYRLRYRRCAGCSTELLQAEKKLELSKKRIENVEGYAALAVIGALLAAGGAVGLAAVASGAAAILLASLVTLALTALSALLVRQHRGLKDEIDALELQLAAFPPLPDEGIAAKGMKWLKGKMGFGL